MKIEQTGNVRLMMIHGRPFRRALAVGETRLAAPAGSRESERDDASANVIPSADPLTGLCALTFCHVRPDAGHNSALCYTCMPSINFSFPLCSSHYTDAVPL